MKLSFTIKLPTDDVHRAITDNQTPEFQCQVLPDPALPDVSRQLTLEEGFKQGDARLHERDVYSQQLDSMKQTVVALNNELEATKMWVDRLKPLYFAQEAREKEKLQVLVAEAQRELTRLRQDFAPQGSVVEVSGVALSRDQLVLKNQELARKVAVLESEIKILGVRAESQRILEQQNIRLANERAYLEGELIVLRGQISDGEAPGKPAAIEKGKKGDQLRQEMRRLETDLRVAQEEALETKKFKLRVKKLEEALAVKADEEEMYKARLSQTASLHLIIEEQKKQIAELGSKIDENNQINARLNAKIVEFKAKQEELLANEAAYHQKSTRLQAHITYLEGLLKTSNETNSKLIARVRELELQGVQGDGMDEEVEVETIQAMETQNALVQEVADWRRRLREAEDKQAIHKLECAARNQLLQETELKLMEAEKSLRNLAEENADLSVDNQKLRMKIQELRETEEELGHTLERLRGQIEDLKAQRDLEAGALIGSTEKVSILEQQNLRLREKNESLEEEAGRNAEAVVVLKGRLEDASRQLGEARLQNQTWESRVAGLQRDILEGNFGRGGLGTSERKGVDIKAELDRSREKIGKLEAEMDQLAGEKRVLEEELGKLSRNLGSSSSSERIYAKQIETLQLRESELEEETANLRDQVARLEEINRDLAQQVAVLEESDRSKSTEIEEIQGKLERALQDLTRERDETEATNTRLSEVTASFREGQARLRTAEVEAERDKAALQEVSKERKELADLLTQSRKELEQREQDLASLQRKSELALERERREKREAQSDLEVAKDKATQLESQLKTQAGELAESKDQLGRLEKDLGERLEKLSTAVSQKDERIQILEQQLRILGDENRELQRQLLNANKSIERLSVSTLERTGDRRATSSPGEASLLRKQLEMVQTELDSKKAELSGLRQRILGKELEKTAPNDPASMRHLSQRDFVRANFPDLDGELVEKDKLIADLKTKMAELTAAVGVAEQKRTVEARKRAEFETEVEKLRQKTATLESELKKGQQEVIAAGSRFSHGNFIEVTQHNTLVSGLKNDLLEAKKSAEAAKEACQVQEKEVQGLQETLARERIAAQEALAKALKEGVEGTEKWRRENQRLTQELENLKERLALVEKGRREETEQLTKRLAAMANESAMAQELAQMSDQLIKLRKENEALKTMVGDFGREIDRLKASIRQDFEAPKVSENILDQIRKLGDPISQLQQKEAEIGILKAEVARLEQLLGNSKGPETPEDVAVLRRTLEGLREERDTLRLEVDELRKKNADLMASLSQKDRDAEEALRTIRLAADREASSLKGEVDRLTRALSEAGSQLGMERDGRVAAESKVAFLEDQLQAFRVEHASCVTPEQLAALGVGVNDPGNQQRGLKERKVRGSASPPVDPDADPAVLLQRIGDLERQLQELASANKALEMNKDQLTSDRVRQLEEEVRELKARLAQLSAKKSRDGQEGGTPEVDKLAVELANLKAEVVKLEEGRAGLVRQVSDLEAEAVRLHEALAQAEGEAQRSRGELQVNVQELRLAQAALQEEQKRLGWTQEEMRRLTQKISLLEDQLSRSTGNSSPDAVANELHQTKTEVARLGDQLKAWEKRGELFQAEIADLQAKLAQKSSRIVDITSESSQNMAKVVQAQREAEDSRLRAASLEATVDHLRSRLAHSNSLLETAMTEKSEAEKQLRTLGLLLEGIRGQEATKDATLRAFEEKLGQQTKLVEGLEGTVEEQSTELRRLRRDVRERHLLSSVLTSEVAPSHSEQVVGGSPADETDSLAKTADDSHEEVNPLSLIVATLREKTRELEEKLDSAEQKERSQLQKLAVLERQAHSFQVENQSLLNQLGELKKTKITQAEEVEILRWKLMVAETSSGSGGQVTGGSENRSSHSTQMASDQRVKVLLEQLEQAKAHQATLTTTLESLQRELDQNRPILRQQSVDLEKLGLENQQLRDKVDHLGSENGRLATSQEEVSRKLALLQARETASAARASELQTEVGRLQVELEKATRLAKDSESRVAGLTLEKELSKTRLEMLEKWLTVAEASGSRHKGIQSSPEGPQEEVANPLESLTLEHRRQMGELRQELVEATKQKAELLVEANVNARLMLDTSAKIDLLEKKAKFWEEWSEDIKREVALLKGTLAKESTTRLEKDAQIAELRSALAKIKRESEGMAKELARLEAFRDQNSLGKLAVSEADQKAILEQRIRQLETEAEFARETSEAVQRKLDKKSEEANSLGLQLRTEKSKTGSLATQLSQEQLLKEEMKRKADTLATEVSLLKQELDKAHSHGTNPKEALALAEMASKALAELSTLKLEVDELRKRLKESEVQMALANQRTAFWKTKADESAEAWERTQSESAQWQKRALTGEATAETAENKAKFLEEELKRRHAQYLASLEDLARRLGGPDPNTARNIQKNAFEAQQFKLENEYLRRNQEQLESQMADRQTQLNQARGKVGALEAQVGALTVESKAKDAKLTGLNQQLEAMRQLLLELKQKSAEHSESIIAVASKQTTPVTQYVVKIEAPKTQLRVRESEVEAKTARSERRVRGAPSFLEGDLKNAREELREKQAEIDRLMAEVEDWKQKFVSFGEKAEGESRKVQFLNVVIENQTRELKDRMAKNNQLKTDLTKAKSEVEVLRAKVGKGGDPAKSKREIERKKSEDRLASVSQELSVSRVKSVNLQKTVDEMELQRQKSQRKLKDAVKQLAETAQAVESKEETVRRLEGQIAKMARDDEERRREVGRLKDKLKKKEQELVQLTAANDAMVQDASNWRQRNARGDADMNRTQHELQRFKEMVRRLEEESERERAAFNDMLEREAQARQLAAEKGPLEEELVRTRAEGEAMRRKIAQLEDSLARTTRERLTSESSPGKSVERHRDLSIRLEKSERDRDGLEVRLRELETLVRDRDAKLGEAKTDLERLKSEILLKDNALKAARQEVEALRRGQTRDPSESKRRREDTLEIERSRSMTSKRQGDLANEERERAVRQKQWEAEVTRKVGGLTKQLEEARARATVLEAENGKLGSEIRDKEGELKRMDLQVQSLKHEENTMRGRLKQLEEEAKAQWTVPRRNEASVSLSQEEFRQLNQRAAGSQAAEFQRDEWMRKAGELERLLAGAAQEAEGQLKKLREQLQRTENELASHKSTAQQRVVALTADVEAKRRLIEELEGSVAQNKKQTNQLEILKRDFEALKQVFETQTDRVLGLENELSDKKSQILRLQEQLNQAITNIQVRKEGVDPAEVQRLQALLRQTQDELGNLRTSQTLEVTNISKKIQTFESENEELKRNMRNADARNVDLTDQLADLQAKLRNAEAELEAMRAARNQADAAAQEQLRVAQDELRSLKSRMTLLAADLKSKEEETEKSAAVASGQIEGLQAQLIEQKNSAARAIGSLKAALEESNSELEEAKAKVREAELAVLSREKDLKNQSKEWRKKEKEWNAKLNQLRAKDTVVIEAPKQSLGELENLQVALGQLFGTAKSLLEKEKNEKLATSFEIPEPEKSVDGFARAGVGVAEKTRQLLKELGRTIEANKNEFARRKLAESILNSSAVGGKSVSLESLSETLAKSRQEGAAILGVLQMLNPDRLVSSVEHPVKGDEPSAFVDAIQLYIQDQLENLGLLRSLVESKTQELARLRKMEKALMGSKGQGASVDDLRDIDSRLRASNKNLLEALRLLNISSVTIKEEVLTQSDKGESWLEQIRSDFRQQNEIEDELLKDIQYLVDQNAKMEQRIRDLQTRKTDSEISQELKEVATTTLEVLGLAEDAAERLGRGGLSRSAKATFTNPEEVYVRVGAWNRQSIDLLKDAMNRLRNLLGASERVVELEREVERLNAEVGRWKDEAGRAKGAERQVKEYTLEIERLRQFEDERNRLKTRVGEVTSLEMEREELSEEVDRLRPFERQAASLKSEVERLLKYETAASKLGKLEDENDRLASELGKLRRAKADSRELEERLETLEGQLDKLSKENEGFRSQNKDLLEEVERLRKDNGRLREVEVSADKFQKERTSFEVELEKYRREIPELAEEVKRLSSFEINFTKANAQLGVLRDEIDALKREVERLKSEATQKDAEKSRLAQRLEDADREIQRLSNAAEALRKLQSTLAEAEERRERAEKELARLRLEGDRLKEVDRENNSLKEEMERLKSQGRVSADRIALLEAEVQRWKDEAGRRSEWEETASKMTEKVKRLEREKAILEGEIEEMQRVRSRSRPPTADLEQLAQLEKENFRLKLEVERLRALEGELARATEKVSRLESLNHKLEAEVDANRGRKMTEADMARLEALERELIKLRLENARLPEYQAEAQKAADRANRFEREVASLNLELDELRRPRKPTSNLDGERADLLERELHKLRLENDRLRVAEQEGVRLAERLQRAEREVQRLTLELEAATVRRKPTSTGDDERLETYERENRRLRSEITELKKLADEVAALEDKNRRLQRENRSLLDEIEALRGSKSRSPSPIHSEEEFRRLRIEVERLRDVQAENSSLEERIRKLQRENKSLLDELEAGRLSRPQPPISLHSDEDFRRLRAELDRLRGVEGDLSIANEKAKKLEWDVKRLNEELEENRRRRTRPESPQFSVEDIRKLRTEIERLRIFEEENETLNEKIRKLNREKSDLSQELEEMVKARNRPKTPVVADDPRVPGLEREVARLKAELERLEEENGRLSRGESELRSLRDEVARLRQVEKENSTLLVKIERMKQLESENERLKGAERELLKLRVEIEKLGGAERDNSDLRDQVNALQEEVSRLKRENARLQSELEQSSNNGAEIARLLERVSQLESQESDLKRELERLRQTLRPLELQNKNLKDEIDKLTARLRPVEQENVSLKDQLDKLRTKKVPELESEIARLKDQLRDTVPKKDLLKNLERLLEPEIKNAFNLRDLTDSLSPQPLAPLSQSPMEFDEPTQAINYLVDLQGKNRLSIEGLADSIPKLKKENNALKNEANDLKNRNGDLEREVDDLRKKLKDMTDKYQSLVDKLVPILQATTHNKRELKAALESMGAYIPRGSTVDDQLPSGKDEAKLLAAIGTQNDNIEKLIKLLAAVGGALKDRPDVPELLEVARKIDNHRRALILEFNLAFSVDFTDTSRITPRDESQPKSVVRNMTETMDHVAVVWEEFRGEFQKKVKLLQAELEKLRSEKDQLVVSNKDLETEVSKKIGSISKLQIKIFMLMSFLKTKVGQ